MRGDGIARLCRRPAEIPQPGPGASFEGGAIAAEARALRRAGGDVGHGIEDGVGVFSEFLEVTGKADFQISIEYCLLVIFPWARLFWQLRPSCDLADQRSALFGADSDGSDGGEGFPEFLSESGHPGEWAGDF